MEPGKGAAVSRGELDYLLDRAEARSRADRDEILDAIRDLKLSMNGQFRLHGEILGKHESQLAVFQDRGHRDMPARWGAAIGGLLAILAGYFGLK